MLSNRLSGNSAMFGVILVLVLLAILVYIEPTYFKYIFKTFLGNLILFSAIGVISILDIRWGIGFAAMSFIIYQAFHISEGFAGSSPGSGGVDSLRGLYPEGYPMPKGDMVWPPSVIDDFIKFQKIHNPNVRFDLDILQKQATAQEVETLLKTGKWPWSPDVQTMYKKAIAENNIINTEPGSSLENAQTVYNQNAILQLLSWNSKEGSFLLNGSIIGHTADMPENINNLIRCGKNSDIDSDNGSSGNGSGDISMQKIEYTGYNGIYGNMNSTVTPVDYNNLPSLVNGFSFTSGVGACNPCVALQNPADYSCPFLLNTGNGAEVSNVWQQLWGIDSEGQKKIVPEVLTPPESSSPEKEKLHKREFPLLNELKNEIIKSQKELEEKEREKKEREKKDREKKDREDKKKDTNITDIQGSIIPPIVSNETHDIPQINYGTKNVF
jgi:hypothetical protein